MRATFYACTLQYYGKAVAAFYTMYMDRKSRVASKAAGVLLCAPLLLLSVLCLHVHAAANPFDTYIASRLSDLLSSGPQWQVKIGKLEGQFPFRLKADRITISDPQGVWAVAENVVFRWSPRTLVRLLIHIEEVSAETVRITRPPTGGEEQKPANGGPFKLPSTLRRMTADQMAVGRLVVEEAVVGQSAAFHLEGSLKAPEAGSGRIIAVHAQRVDEGPQMRADLEGALTGDETRDLKLKAHFFEASGGWVAVLLGMGDAGPLNLQLQGEGPLSSWKGTLEGSAGKFGAVHSDIGMNAEKEINLVLAGYYDPADELLPPDLVPLLGRQTRFELAAQIDPSEFAAVRDAGIWGAGYQLRLSGRLDLTSRAISGQWSLAVDDLAVVEPLLRSSIAGNLAARGELSGTLNQPGGTMMVSVGGLQTRGVQVEKIHTDLQFKPLEPEAPSLSGFYLTGRGSAEGLAALSGPPLPEDSLQWSLEASVPLGSTDRKITIDDFQVESEYSKLELAGALDPRELVGNFGILLRIKSLEPFAAYLGQEVPGALALQANIDADMRSLSASAQMSGELTGADSFPPELAALVSSGINFAGAVELQNGARLSVTEFHAESATFQLSTQADVDLPGKTVNGSWEVHFPKLAPLEPALNVPVSGSLKAEGHVRGPFDNLEVTASLDSDSLVLNGTELQQAVSQLSASGVPKNPSGSVQVTMLVQGEKLSASTGFSLHGDTLSLSSLSVTVPPGNKLTGSLAVNLKSYLIQGSVDGSFPKLSAISRFLGEPIEGNARLIGRFSQSNGAQKALVRVNGQEIKGGFGSVGKVALVADVDKLWESPRGEVDVKMEDLQRPGMALNTAAFGIAGSLERAQFKGAVKGRSVEPFNVQTAGALSRSGSTYRVQLSVLRGDFGSYPLRLFEPVTIEYSPEAVSIGTMAIAFGRGRIEASGRIASQQVVLDAGLEQIPLSLLSLFGAPELQGRAAGTLRVRGSPSSPSASMNLKVTGVRIEAPETRGIPAATLVADADVRGGRLIAAVAIYGPVEKPISAELSIPVVFSLTPFNWSLPDQGPITGRLNAQGDLSNVSAWLPLRDSLLSGRFDVDLGVGGTLASPDLSGRAVVQNGSYQNLEYGTVLENLDIVILTENQRLRIERFTATDGEGGSVTASGWVAFERAGQFPLQLDVAISSATLIRRTDARATTSGDLQLSGSLSQMALRGGLNIVSAEITLPKRLPATITKLDVIEINLPKGKGAPKAVQAQPPEASPSMPAAVRMDLRIEAPGKIFMRGRGLDSEWKGTLRITGTAENPSIVGELSTVRGRLEVLDTQFKLTEGSIRFHGATPISPTVDIKAEAKTKDITAQVVITGSVSEPKLELQSDPSLPNDEILARLLFNRNVSQLGPLQVLKLAKAVSALSGRTDAFDVLGRTRKFLGLEQLELREVGEGGEGQLGIGLGKYLTEDIYVDVEQGFGGRSGKVTANVEVTPNITVQSNIGMGETGPGIGVLWNYDY